MSLTQDFHDIKEWYQSADNSQITQQAKQAFAAITSELLDAGLDANMVIYTMINFAKLGMVDNDELKEEEKALIKEIFGEYIAVDMEEFYTEFQSNPNENTYALLSELVEMNREEPSALLSILHFIFSFGYVDKIYNEENLQQLEQLFQ